MRVQEARGHTCVLVAVGHRLVALLSIADPLKPEAASVVAALRNLGVACCMLTGDNKRTAQAVASQLRVDAVFAEVLPAEKAQVGDPHLGGGVEETHTGVKETYIQGIVLLPAGSDGEAMLGVVLRPAALQPGTSDRQSD